MLINGSLKPMSATSVTMGKNILSELHKTYPGLKAGWRVTIAEGIGMIYVTNELLSGKMGIALHINKIEHDYKNFMKMVGEMLERYNVLRHPTWSQDEVMKNVRYMRTGEASYSV